MGGNALKTVETRRYSADEYFTAVAEIERKLMEFATSTGTRIYATPVKAYRKKESFGDADFLVVYQPPLWATSSVWAYDKARGVQPKRQKIGNSIEDVIKRVFNPREVVPNGPVTSFDYNDLQVDFIQVFREELAFAQVYFNYNDLGNFVGRIAERMNLKFGHNGLWFELYDPDCETLKWREILVTQDPWAALSFLGLCPAKARRGFDTMEEVFEYVASSNMFNPSLFYLENRCSESRRRDRSRESYRKFLEWIDAHYPRLPGNAVDKISIETTVRILGGRFPGFQKKYDAALEEIRNHKAFKLRFNGDNYSLWFDVEGRDLGDLMAQHRQYIEQHNLAPVIRSLDLETFKTLAFTINDTIYKTMRENSHDYTLRG